MKKAMILLSLLAVSYTAAMAQDKAQTSSAGKFSFKEETHDYGTVPEGPAAEYDFVFENTGTEPIVISEAHGSCGCTVAKWPKEPVMPGKRNSIHVTYNTAGRPGTIAKDVIISSNAEQKTMVLHVKGTVKSKASESPKTASTTQ